MSNGVEITIGGVKVQFPNRPYPSQISMMDKIIRGLQKGQNCLLESPTGSGKTLSLLCSVLAWHRAETQSRQQAAQELARTRLEKLRDSCYCDCDQIKSKYFSSPSKSQNFEDTQSSDCNDDNHYYHKNLVKDCACVCHGTYNQNDLFNDLDDEIHKKSERVPTIYFTTRTHKQITNVLKEYKKTPYAATARMTILASRQHTCIHGLVSKKPNKDELCKKLRKHEMPTNNEGIDNLDEKQTEALSGGCGFFSRYKKQQINYDNYGFKEPVWDIEDLVKLFKKKRFCPYYGARDIMDSVDIIFAPYNYIIDPKIRSSMNINLKNSIVIVDEAHNTEDACRESTTFQITKFQIQSCIDELNKLIESTFVPDETKNAAIYFIKVFDRLVEWIDRTSLSLQPYGFDGEISPIFSGLEMVAEFKLQGIGPDKYDLYKKNMGHLSGEDQEENKEMPEVAIDGSRLLVKQIFLMLEFLYMQNHEYMDDFKVAVIKTKAADLSEDDEFYSASQVLNKNKSNKPKQQWNYTINFWCLNPAVAFYYLKNCHSVILCSGTLSPMETFQSELGVKFEHQLEANHVISEKQVWVGCLGYGPTNVNLLANYKNCEMYQFQDEIGRLVLDVCMTIPFGVLCFLPSYTLLNKLLNRWNDNRIIEKIKEYKEIFSETKVAKNFDQLLKDYYDCINKCSDTEKHNGALLLGVYRGRASEGLDFSDNYGRAVIAVGIPYPNIKDIQVDLKRKYNNTLCNKKNLLTGDEWYEIQAYRAVNQALGRCIRHRNDWGAIILVDDRYFRQPQKYIKGLSKWIRKCYKTYSSYTQAISSLKEFSNQMKDFNRETQLTQQFSQSQIQSTFVSEIKPITIKYEEENDSLHPTNASTESSVSNYSLFSNLKKKGSTVENSKTNSLKSNSSKKNQSSNKQFLGTLINESPKIQTNNLNQSPVVSSGNKKRQRPTQLDKAVTPNLKEFQYNSNSKFEKSSKNINKDWICIDDDISYIKLDNSSSSQEDLEPKSDDDFEIEFSRIKKEKQRKLLDETNTMSYLANKEEKDDKKGEDDELDFDQDTDTQINPSKHIKTRKNFI